MTVLSSAIWLLLTLLLLLAGPLWMAVFGPVVLNGDWRTATHRSTSQAPDPATHPEAVVQVYAARAFGWRGAFAVHTWIAAKPAGARSYTRYEVIGWRLRARRSAISITSELAPDAEWYGAPPRIVQDLRGAEAEVVIGKLGDAVKSYPYPDIYKPWPGPNSNTFLAHIGREIPELRLNLPATAIGKDFLPDGRIYAASPSGTGVQVSFSGLLGLLAGTEEGLEVNVLGLVVGLDLRHPAFKLPGIGRVPDEPLSPGRSFHF